MEDEGGELGEVELGLIKSCLAMRCRNIIALPIIHTEATKLVMWSKCAPAYVPISQYQNTAQYLPNSVSAPRFARKIIPKQLPI